MGIGYLLSVAPLGGGALAVALIRQLRLHVNDSRDRKFARHVFNQTRSTDALDGYRHLVRDKRTAPWRGPQPERDRPDGGEPDP